MTTVSRLIVVLLVLVAVVFVARAWGAPAGGLSTGRINVTATLMYSTTRAVPPAGRQSDAAEQSWRITDRYGKAIGRMIVWCRWIRPRSRFCTNELTMPRGKIVATGSSLTQFEGEYAVVGGTGAYSRASGVLLFTAIGIRKTVLLVTVTD